MSGPLLTFLMHHRRPWIVVFHLALAVLTNYAAFWLRFDGAIPTDEFDLFARMLPWLIVIRGLTFLPWRLYEGLWRYTGVWDLRNIIGGVLVSSVVFYGVVHWGYGLTKYPRSVFLIDALLLLVTMGGVRLIRRMYRELWYREGEKRILIYGAGDAGEMIVRDMKNSSDHEYEPLGFIDDDSSKVGQRIHGVKVLGTRDVLASVIAEKSPDVILVAIPRAGPSEVRKIVRALEPFKVPIKTLPNLKDVLGGRVAVGDIRSLSIEDLLDRVPVGLDTEPVRHFLQGKRVLVTGAGGSIGSELCRQIADFQPSSLVLLDRYENGLHTVAVELGGTTKNGPVHAVVADVTDQARIDQILSVHRPNIVFHAAAHKHVPLMELNPGEAVKNNVGGTRVLAEAARRHGVERFILISTDKAVNPSSVMGASKRVAELFVQAMNGASDGTFSCVRFGNVLASNGSVVPHFLAQIKAGGPVTVTHPEMRRYFMLIPEAVQLVLHAAALARGGEMFVLDMGEQIKVLDLARNLIRLSGFVPDEEIPITFVGLRPGEKLFEELTGTDEAVEPSATKGIGMVTTRRHPAHESLVSKIQELERAAELGEPKPVIELLKELVPTYKPE